MRETEPEREGRRRKSDREATGKSYGSHAFGPFLACYQLCLGMSLGLLSGEKASISSGCL
jgi:hypothetical protein